MKNLLIYINPKRNFSEEWIKNGELLWKNETENLLKIQIENSFNLGWKHEDIILVMNFPWEYLGVKSIVVDDNNYCKFAPTASKINAICELFDRGLIGDDLYWFHDNDAFQIGELDIDVKDEIAITDYGITICGRKIDERWSTGTIFFRKESEDVFKMLQHAVNNSYKRNEEIALLAMTRCNYGHINDRIKKINITYNFATRRRNIPKTFEIADKPLRVIHFHPLDPREAKTNKEIVPQLLPESLNNLLNKHIYESI